MTLVDVVRLSETKCKNPIKAKLKYATEKNFVGRVINGYEPNLLDVALMTPNAAKKLCEVQNYLIEQYGYGLFIYDAYRPKRAVNDFVFWSKQTPVGKYELERKQKHYPNIQKNQLFELGYVAEDSGHCYGNTVDLVLIDIKSGEKLEMGACFDYMDEKSHITAKSDKIGETACKNREILSTAMQKFGFHTYQEEYWHFSHGGKEGREVENPIDIEISKEMKGIGIFN
ncbi:MAG: peptidase M15 [Legionella longbeachae]|nr:peptidase M15 [Legionella longbeachae]